MNFHTSSAFQSISAIAYLVIGFMAGLAVALLTGITSASLPLPTPAIDTAATTTNTFPPDSGDVAVSDQPAGVTVLVDSVTVPPPGVWVAVEDVNEDGTLGNVLGAALVGHPESNISVGLERNTLPGQEYAIVLYRDDGDGKFELGSDSLYVDFDTGQPAEEVFKTFAAGQAK